MNYQTYAPHQTLADFVKCYWVLESPASEHPERQRIVPDGCMEMIFHYCDLYKQYNPDGSSVVQPRCFVFGQVTAPLEIEPTGSTGIFSVRFQPDGFTAFTPIDVKEMENRAIGLETLFGKRGLLLEKVMLSAATAKERINSIEAFLLERLQLPESVDRIARSSVAVIMELNGQVSVQELSGQLQVNRRQLERRFSSAIGLSPKQLAKIIRLQATLQMLQKKQFTSLTSLAYENGYFDQAHFIKDFREFTGLSPKQFFAANLTLSALFIAAE